ncbi:glycosyltransferase family 2 protein [Candidatus Gracilibacteria bacterium]|nr:glycosyltransferase family 2 protein [Candidatus Gracilibacteria bacterium]
MPKNKIIFLIRAYNESTRIRGVIESIISAGYSEILVIDDGSTDGTEVFLSDFIKNKNIHYVRHVANRGAGAALETGFSYVRSRNSDNHWKYLVTFDADGQHDIRDMELFRSAFETDPTLDVVLGSRFITKTDTNVPFFRRVILWGGMVFTSLISGVHLTDAHNGYRMMRVKVLDHIRITMDGMEYASELIDQIGSYQLHFVEVPVNIHYDEYTLGKGQRHGGPLRIAARMILKKFF